MVACMAKESDSRGVTRADQGRDGRWLPGNRAGEGTNHPHSALVIVNRGAWLEATTPEQVQAVKDHMFQLATTGRGKVAVMAATLWLDRSLGKERAGVDVEHRHTLEQLIGGSWTAEDGPTVIDVEQEGGAGQE